MNQRKLFNKTCLSWRIFFLSLMVLLIVVLVLIIWLCRRYSPLIYDLVIVKMTSVWYREVLQRCEPHWRVLDVGIGTGTSLITQRQLLIERDLHVVGVDIDEAYVRHCQESLKKNDLHPRCQCHCRSIFDPQLNVFLGSASFDAVYFSGSIALMPQPDVALQVAASLLKPQGKIFVTQTFQRKGFPLLGFFKPLLRYLTTIDFGQLTYEHQVDQIIEKSGLKLIEKSVIKNSVDNAFQAAFILVLEQQK